MPGMKNAHALVVGIASYANFKPLPPTVLKDAQDIYTLLIDQNHCGYSKENVKILPDKEATQDAIRTELDYLAAKSDEDSTVLIYMSCHGAQIDSGVYLGEYLLPIGAESLSEQSLARTSISSEEFTEAIRKIKARKVVVLFDCCHAGGIGQPKSGGVGGATVKAGLSEDYYRKLESGWGRVIIASSRSTEESWVLDGDDNSLFTKHLLDGLRGGALGSGGVIRIFDLFRYVQSNVSTDHPGQHPIFKAEIEMDFPIALYKGKSKSAEPVSEVLPADSFTYDAFISYLPQEPDKGWVQKKLLPRLKEEGLRVATEKTFRLGAPRVKEMERAVEQSRYTLAILSPNYLKNNFTDLEGVLAQHLGLEKSERRLLAIMRVLCEPRLGIRANLGLDMTDDEEFETELARLVYELRLPPVS